MIYLYGYNQLCLKDFKYKKNKNDNKKKINEIKISKHKKKECIPKSYKCSGFCKGYDPSNLFSGKNYYCSENSSPQYIEFEFDNEYFFNEFEIVFFQTMIVDQKI